MSSINKNKKTKTAALQKHTTSRDVFQLQTVSCVNHTVFLESENLRQMKACGGEEWEVLEGCTLVGCHISD